MNKGDVFSNVATVACPLVPGVATIVVGAFMPNQPLQPTVVAGVIVSFVFSAVLALLARHLLKNEFDEAVKRCESSLKAGETRELPVAARRALAKRKPFLLILAILFAAVLVSAYILLVYSIRGAISESDVESISACLLVFAVLLCVFCTALGLYVMYGDRREELGRYVDCFGDGEISPSCSHGSECMEKLGIIEQQITPTYAATATCIPMRYDKNTNSVHALLVFNTAYENKCWMFPGGHTLPKTGDADDRGTPPDETARQKCKQEVGCDVEIIDLYGSYRGLSMSQVDNMKPLRQPHYSYLFDLSNLVKCYKEKGHRHHFDSVFIGQYSEESEKTVLDDKRHVSSQKHPFETVVVTLDNECMSRDEISRRLRTAIGDYVNELKIQDPRYQTIGEYPAAMLHEAHTDYIVYLEREAEKIGVRR